MNDDAQYTRHIFKERTKDSPLMKISYCGVPIFMGDFYFIDIQHVLDNFTQGGRIKPCPECIKKVQELLKEIEK